MVESIKELRRICYQNKTSPTPFYNKYIGQPLSIYITKVLLYTSISANTVTGIILALGIAASLFFFGGHFIIGLLLLHLCCILDDVDGEIARYRKKTSMLGMYLDSIYHHITPPLFLFGYAYGVFRITNEPLFILLGFAVSFLSNSLSSPPIFTTIAAMRMRKGGSPKITISQKGAMALEMEGSSKQYTSRLLGIYQVIRDIWTFPSSLLMISALVIAEWLNTAYLHLLPPFALSLGFYAIFSLCIALIQLSVFIYHVKNKSIEHYYLYLFGRK